jgi:O-antigen/teichoic acid export membrane protein
MSIARNTVVTILGTVATIAVTIVTVPLYIKAIGLERYGVLAVVWTVLTYFGLVELGVSGALVQRLARGGHSPQRRVLFYWTGFSMNAVMGLAGSLLLMLTFKSIMSMMSFETAKVANEVSSAGAPIAALLLVLTLRSINNSVLYGAERFVAATTLAASEAIASAVVPLVVAMTLTVDVASLILSILAVRAFFLVVSFATIIRSLPGFKFSFGTIGLARDLLSIGFWFWLAGIIGPLLTYFDRLLIGGVVGVAQLPYYSVPQTILQQSSHVPRAFGSVLFPRFSSEKDETEAIRLTEKAMEAMAFVITPAIVLLILGMEPLLTVWISRDFANKSALIGIVVMISLLPSAMARIIASQLNGRNRPDLVVKILLLELIPYAIALYAFAVNFGLLGVALVWTFRASADVLLLGRKAKVLKQMLIQLRLPMALIVVAVIVCVTWGIEDPRRWLGSILVLCVVMAWEFYFMPPTITCALNRLPVIRRISVGRLYKGNAG